MGSRPFMNQKFWFFAWMPHFHPNEWQSTLEPVENFLDPWYTHFWPILGHFWPLLAFFGPGLNRTFLLNPGNPTSVHRQPSEMPVSTSQPRLWTRFVLSFCSKRHKRAFKCKLDRKHPPFLIDSPGPTGWDKAAKQQQRTCDVVPFVEWPSSHYSISGHSITKFKRTERIMYYP